MNKDLISSLFWFCVGLFFCVGGINYQILNHGTPCPGLLPFMVGSTLAILSLSILISSLRKNSNDQSISAPFFSGKGSFKRVLFVCLSLIVYTLFVETLGFSITLLIFMVFLLRYIEPQDWKTVLIVAVISVVACNLLFRGLGVQMPRGIVGL
jgi:putative tricarboxylic transport membrane protein